MLDLETKLLDLDRSTRYIREGRARIRHQIALVKALRAKGYDATSACELLAALRCAMAAERQHRALIVVLSACPDPASRSPARLPAHRDTACSEGLRKMRRQTAFPCPGRNGNGTERSFF